jgi:D-serine deaminase-like pyridoxal phosphate-dependent protein
MQLSDLDTPALLIDFDIMERNLRRVAEYTKTHGLRLRPHTKTHKIPALGKMQLASGAVGLTVAKVGEAEVMLATDPPDLLVAFPLVGQAKLKRLIPIARQTRVTISLDSLVVARQLSEAAHHEKMGIGVLAEVDVGLGRVGVSPGQELVQLAQDMARLPGLTFEGIAFFPGHVRKLDEKGLAALRQVGMLIQQMRDDFRRAGLEAHIISGGSTPTLFHSHEILGLNEIRPGTYIYNDMNTVRSGACSLDDCAASVLVTVVSTARPGQVIIDGGSKTFSSDLPMNAPERTFGRVIEAPGCVFHNMNEEHGFIDIRNAGQSFTIGDRIRIIPNHICPAVNLHERVYGIRNGEVAQVWKVEGRGRLQ